MSRRNKRERKKVEHAFGPAYGSWLDYFELIEDFIKERSPVKYMKYANKKIRPPWAGNCLFFDPDKVAAKITNANGDMIPLSQWSEEAKNYQIMYECCWNLWGQYAQALRNAFKFKVTESDFYKAIKRTSDPIEVTTYLPFENVFIQITPDKTWEDDPNWTNADGADIRDGFKELLFCERQKCKEDYSELNLKKGETFICITPAIYVSKETIKALTVDELSDTVKPLQPLSKNAHGIRLYPVELHLEENQHVFFEKSKHYKDNPHWQFTDGSRGGLNAYATGADPTDWNRKQLTSMYLIHFFNFLWLLNFKESKQTNYGRVKAENVIRRKPKHRKKHPVYEYSVLELDLNKDEPSTNIIMPRECTKKRQHMVIGHWRTYKKPLKSGPNKGKTEVLIKEHWRGDKSLGVIRKDYIFNGPDTGEQNDKKGVPRDKSEIQTGEPDDESTIH